MVSILRPFLPPQVNPDQSLLYQHMTDTLLKQPASVTHFSPPSNDPRLCLMPSGSNSSLPLQLRLMGDPLGKRRRSTSSEVPPCS